MFELSSNRPKHHTRMTSHVRQTSVLMSSGPQVSDLTIAHTGTIHRHDFRYNAVRGNQPSRCLAYRIHPGRQFLSENPLFLSPQRTRPQPELVLTAVVLLLFIESLIMISRTPIIRVVHEDIRIDVVPVNFTFYFFVCGKVGELDGDPDPLPADPDSDDLVLDYFSTIGAAPDVVTNVGEACRCSDAEVVSKELSLCLSL